MYAFGKVGISLPHSSYALWNAGTKVSRDQLAVGDLVFFSGLGHVGIYVGGGSYVHAPRTGDVVKVSSMSDRYANGSYVGAVRI
jgi:cell wall-associated NlpC family hydrolase